MSEPTSTKLEIEMVINRCCGGFDLSTEAQMELARRKGVTLEETEGGSLVVKDQFQRLHDMLPRHDPDLIAVVREMGEKASGPRAKLRIARVVVEIDVTSNDGFEEPEGSAVIRSYA